MSLRLGKYLHYTIFLLRLSLPFAFLSPYNDLLFLQALFDSHHLHRKEFLLKCECVWEVKVKQTNCTFFVKPF